MADRNRVLYRGLAAALIVLVLAAGCGNSSSGDDESSASTTTEPLGPPVIGGKIVYGVIAESNGWDPAASNWGPWSLLIANSMFDTLSRWDTEGNIQPYLASNFFHNDDFTEWTIETRENVVFHNGEPFNAQALKMNLDFHHESALTGQIFSRQKSVEIVDDRNVKVTLTEPVANFPAIFSTQVGVMMAPEMIADPDRALHPIGTGPFKLDEWTPDARMVLVRNDDYWQFDADGNRLPYLDEVEFRPIPDDGTRIDSLLAGDLDLAQISNIVHQSQFRDNPDFQVFSDRRSEEDEYFVMLNTAVAPFDDLTARQALAYATDRDAFNQAYNEGKGQPAESAYRPDSVWYTDVDYPEYDPDKARDLVAEYEKEHGPLKFSMKSSSQPRQIMAAQWLQQHWKDVGIDVEIDGGEIASQIASIVLGDYQATTWVQFGGASPLLEEVWWDCYYVAPPGEVGLNFARNCDEKMSDAIKTIRQSPDNATVKEANAVVQQRLADTLPYIFLTHTEVAVVARPEVTNVLRFQLPNAKQGLAFNNGAHPLHQIWLEE